MITDADKKRIVARAFFNDNQDQYEDYHEALAEFMNADNTSPAFIESAVAPFLKPIEGHKQFVNDSGHVIAVRLVDGYMDPDHSNIEEETEWTTYCETIIETIDQSGDLDPDTQLDQIMAKVGWRLISEEVPKDH